jgi:broad specificity phosphatase PhoE
VNAARVIFVRHAEPQGDVLGRIYGRLDVALSARGAAHAERIAAALAPEAPARVYTSPLRRAVATAKALSDDPVVVDDLREIDFGELEGLTVEEAAERYAVESLWADGFPGGESLAAVRARAVAAAHAIAGRHAGESVVAVSHAVVIRTILADALGMDPAALFRLDQSYGGISVVEWLDGDAFVRVVNAVGL